MSLLDQQISRAHRRMTSNALLEWLTRGVVIGACAWALAVLIERAFALGIPLGPSLGAAALVALLVAGVGTYLARISRLSAAIQIDAAAGLKERVSSALSLRRSTDVFALAAVRDAEAIAAKVQVARHLPLRAPRLWPWSLGTALTAALVYALMPALNLFAGDKKRPADETALAQQAHKELQQALDEQHEKMQKRLDETPGLKDLAADLDKLELPKEPTAKPDDVRREAVKQIERVADKLQERLDAADLKSLDELKRELAKLETPRGEDKVSKLTESLSKGDMEGAQKALAELKKELEDAAKDGDPEAKQKLGDLAKKMESLSDQLAKLGDSQKLQKELENKAGLSEEQAKQLMDQLAKMDPKDLEKLLQQQLSKSGMNQQQIKELAKKMAANKETMQKMQSMAKAMSKAAEAAKACQNPGSAPGGAMEGMSAALSDAGDQISAAEMAEQMANELQSQLAELQSLCEGQCNGNSPGRRPDWGKIGQQGGNEGFGTGSRIGKNAVGHQLDPTKANVKMSQGQIIGQMVVDGPISKGEASAQVRDAVNSAVRDATDAIERERVPRQYESVLRKYFEELAGLGGGRAPRVEDAERGKTPAPSPSEPE